MPVAPTDKYCGDCGTDLAAAAVAGDPMVGALVADRYRIEDKLGDGTFGAVYRCVHVRMGNEMAIKILREDLSRSQRLIRLFYEDARTVSRLSNPHTVTVLDFGRHEGAIYIVTEYLHGVDLGTLLQEVGHLTFLRAANLVAQACDSLAEAHSLGILHLDLKPENILVARTRDGGDFVWVVDYGLAVLDQPEAAHQSPGYFRGAPYYVAPEQVLDRELDARTDIYALGALLFHMITGRPPYEDRTAVGVLQRHVDEPVPDPVELFPRLGLHPEVSTVIKRAMAKDPAQRYGSVGGFKAHLEAVVEEIKAMIPPG